MGSGFCAHPGGRFTGCAPPRAATGEVETISIKTANSKIESLIINITSSSSTKRNPWPYATIRLSISYKNAGRGTILIPLKEG